MQQDSRKIVVKTIISFKSIDIERAGKGIAEKITIFEKCEIDIDLGKFERVINKN